MAGCAVVGVVGCAAAVIAGPVAALITAVSTALVAHRWRSARAVTEAAAAGAAGAESLTALAAELRAGRDPAAAFAGLDIPAGTRFAAAVRSARAAAALGADPGAALRQGASADGLLDRWAIAWQISDTTGASLADVVEQVAMEARTSVAAQRRADAEVAGARATGGLLAGLPLLGLGLGQAMGAHPLHVLLRTPAGALCSAGGLALEVAGLAWLNRLTRAAVG